MKQEKEILQEKVYFVLNNLNSTGTIKNLLRSSLLDDYMNKSLLTKILNLNLPLNNLSISELFHIIRLINSYEKKIEIEEYFTDTEINQAMENKNNLKIDVNPIIKLENVLYNKSKYDSWICIVTYKQLHDWLKTGKIIYDLSTQRTGILRKIGNERIIFPYINEKSVNEIKNAMLKDEFYINMISFNIMPNYNYNLEYDSKDKILIIDTNIFIIAIIDGMHRILALSRALEENSNLQGELYLKITNMTKEKAQDFIRQEAKVNKQDLESLEKYNPDNKITMIINNINNLGSKESNILNGRIDMGVNTPNTWIPFEYFKDALSYSGFMDDINETDNFTELKSIENFIVDFITSFYKVAEEYNIKIKNDEILTDATFIMGLIITARRYYGKKEINIKSINEFIKRFKFTQTNYIYDYPLKAKDRREMISKFSRLLEVK